MMQNDEQLDKLKREVRSLQEKDRDWFNDALRMQGKINEQTGQIAALKTALLKDRFWMIWKGGECASVEKATAKATSQLAREMPDIFGEDKQ
jgi:hypothetical protein